MRVININSLQKKYGFEETMDFKVRYNNIVDLVNKLYPNYEFSHTALETEIIWHMMPDYGFDFEGKSKEQCVLGFIKSRKEVKGNLAKINTFN